ncbi:intradiol ring-cleavage dioxygenase (plasmid) [Rhizobium leguminosarum bv. trifolii WSM1325]|uniref:Intradiol ring-cleavage dioxygenase n=1 Tax=Rhizobium leguminosarum bv. trifolii (strain WSM1325) TaxID=395491 RepID=C6B8W9_RHILS|nr:dioxygenase [Rhizobium leguminosarum]ACS60357.1 intradiol ring-cleavage dioxygenase [Rhizobium leguminosarum bv. trifolii WSM1325]
MTPGPMALNFSEATSHDIFAQRLQPSKDNILPQVLAAAVTHLHTLIREVRPTQAEWRQVIEFLTDVGHASDERRQEWVLLSDLLGASTLVEEINSRRPKTATPNTVRGPFFRADVPQLPLGGNISLDGIGEPLEVSGRVQDLDGDPIANAEIITWQANAQGLYENQQPDLQPEFNLRGGFRTDPDGRFHYRTIKPCGYGVPDDGPVGKLLRRAGYPLRRPAHLHFIIKGPDFETITTHIYDGSDPHLAEDAIFAVKPELVRTFEQQGKGWLLKLTFVMVRARQGADT